MRFINECMTFYLLKEKKIKMASRIPESLFLKINQLALEKYNGNKSKALTTIIQQYFANSPNESNLFQTSETNFQQFELPNMNIYYNKESPIIYHNTTLPSVEIFNGIYEADQVHVNFTPTEYQLPHELQHYNQELIEFWKYRYFKENGFQAMLYNDKISRLIDLKVIGSKLNLATESTHYFDSLVTNYSLDTYINNWKTTIRARFAPQPKLEELSQSKLSNHFGIGAMFITSDDYLILQNRSQITAMFRGGVYHSLGGACRIDTTFKRDGSPHPHQAVITLAGEQYGIRSDDFSKLILIGGARHLIQGGSPNLFFVGHLNLSYKELKLKLSKYQPKSNSNIWKISSIFGLPLKTDSIHSKYIIERLTEKSPISLHYPLLVSLYFLEKYILVN
jgi:hypothetical protein